MSLALSWPLVTWAGDILRGGAARNAPTAPGNSANTSAAAEAARANAKDALARTTQALQAVQNMQAAARAAAKKGPNNLGANPNAPTFQLPDVPDGIGPGGLEVHPNVATDPTLWTGANKPTQSGNTVNITQTSQQAVLNWKTFNVGKNTTVNFDQSAGGSNVGTWIAFNKITDPSGTPSQILGSINATGQVYVINQNGIIFGGSSQVNTHTLVASSLPINGKYNTDGLLVNDATNANLLTRGLLNNPDSQFLFSALPQNSGTKGPTSAFTPPAAPASGVYGDVTVQSGAQLSAPTSAEHVGGRVALVGANVRNAGTISTPDGQTILAAGLQVGFDSHKSSDPSLRGLDVYVGAISSPSSSVAPYAGTASNSGLINVPRGNATLTGKTVNQLGAINSSTSVSLNGRIDLLANYGAVSNTQYDAINVPDNPPFLLSSSGAVNIGAGSEMYIRPESESTETIARTTLPLQSEVKIQGQSVYMAPGSVLNAPSAKVNVNAGVWSVVASTPPRSYFVNSGGQIYLDNNALINVAGSVDVPVNLSQYIINVTLRGSELAGSPLQRSSIFRVADGNNPTITVDLRKTGTFNGFYWVGTPLADLSGYLNLIQRTVSELSTAGGTVNLNAGGSVVVQPGAKVDVSGGFLSYQGGTVKTTRVFTSGHLLDIADATPDMVYDSFYTGKFTETHPRWGVTKTYLQPLALLGEHYEQGYLSGASGGALTVQASAMALDGIFTGNTLSGPRQRETPTTPSSLSLSFQKQDLTPAPEFPLSSPNPPAISFGESTQAPTGPFALDSSGSPLPISSERQNSVVISPTLISEQGFGQFKIENPDGSIVVPANVALQAQPLGSITLTAAKLNVLGELRAPGGKINLSVFNISPSVATASIRNSVTVSPNLDRGLFTLGSGATISTAGLLIDDRLNSPSALNEPLVTKGGDVTISAYSADLSTGSVIDVSGGVAMNAFGKSTYGIGGSITIKTGQDNNLATVLGGKLHLGSKLLGYSGAVGGSLNIQASAIQIGGAPLHQTSLVLQPEFFNEGGFSNFSLTGLGIATEETNKFVPGFYIASGEVIEPVAKSLVAIPHVPGEGGLGTEIVDAPVGIRSPVSLHFNASGVKGLDGGVLVRGDLVMNTGAVIRTDPQANVSLTGNTVAVLGSIFAPAGNITISGGKNSISLFNNEDTALATVYIGPRSVLSARGTELLQPDAFGRRIGSILPGGTISVSGNIVAASGAVLDVSGASGILDLHPTSADPLLSYSVPTNSGLTAPRYSLLSTPVQVDSNGGQITLTGGQMLFTDATLLGKAGGPSALGGGLSISSGRFYIPTIVTPPATDTNLVVKQTGSSLPTPFLNDNQVIGNPVAGAIALGYFSVDTFTRGGFDSLTLKGNLGFIGPVNIQARTSLSIADGGILRADSDVHLRAPSVTLGQPFITPALPQDQASQIPFTNVPPTYGTGRLFVDADHIDLGTLILQDIGEARLNANRGDIRGNGIVTIAGNLTLRAAQIYPTTLNSFSVYAYDYSVGGTTNPGSITVLGSGAPAAMPLSAGGSLSLYASVIYQQGVLRAPFGTINLGWDGIGTSPTDPVTGTALPFPKTSKLTLDNGSIVSVSGVDPATGIGITVPYGISPDGTTWVDPRGVDISGGGLVEKGINLSASSLTMNSGATLDLRGGGDLLAYRWINGNGGAIDILGTGSSAWSASASYNAGDLVTYNGVTYSARLGNTGITPSISLTWTATPQRFAVLPDYQNNYAPYAPFNNSTSTSNLISGNGPGYVNTSLNVGDRVYLGGSGSLKAGVYTLLPARYALLPGAVLVTPKSGSAIGTYLLPGGASLVSGYQFNELNSTREVPQNASRFEVAPSSVIAARATYNTYLANSFLKDSASRLNITTPRLPEDSGYLLFQANQSMTLQGTVLARPTSGGRGASVDIDTPLDILISNSSTSANSGVVALSSSFLSSFGADSLLIGGKRTRGSDGTTIAVSTGNITVDNNGSPLSAGDLILASTKQITLAHGAQIQSTGTLTDSVDKLLISGNGTLLRVSQDSTASITRSGISSSVGPSIVVRAGAQITGSGIILDSSELIKIDPTAVLTASAYTLNARRISLQLTSPGGLQPDAGLVLNGPILQNLQTGNSLSLLSYSSIDIYGQGQVGGSLSKIALNAAEIRGFNQGAGTASFASENLILGGSASATAPGVEPTAVVSGTVAFNAGVLHLAAGQLAIDQYSTVEFNATEGIIGEGTGGVTVQKNLIANTPVIAGAAGAKRDLSAGGSIVLNKSGTSSVTSGLGSTLNITGTIVSVGSDILLPSGSLTIRANTGDLTISGALDVSGTAQAFYDMTKYTDGGDIQLTSDTGNVLLNSTGSINVAAQSTAGNAGSLKVSTINGLFTATGSVNGKGGVGGKNGSFTLDALRLTSGLGSSTTSALSTLLASSSFTNSQSIRVRSGDVMLNGVAKTSNFSLSVDQGKIDVVGTVDASGVTGGSIFLSAFGDITLKSLTTNTASLSSAGTNVIKVVDPSGLVLGQAVTGTNVPANSVITAISGSNITLNNTLSSSVASGSTLTFGSPKLTVAAQQFNNAGKGGAISLEAGAQINGTAGTGFVDIQTGSTIDLSVASKVAGSATTVGSSAYQGQFSGTLHLRAPQTTSALGYIRVKPINGTIVDPSSILVEGYQLTAFNNANTVIQAGTTTIAGANVLTNNLKTQASNFMSNYSTMFSNLVGGNTSIQGVTVIAPGIEIVNRGGNINLGSATSTFASDWDLSGFRFGPSNNIPGVLTLRAAGNINFFNALSDGFTPTLANTNASWIWLAVPTAANASLPLNTQSWSYRITSGADVKAADYAQVLPKTSLGASVGSVTLGKNGGNMTVSGGDAALTSTAIGANAIGGGRGLFQVIRTGSGNIEINSGQSVQLMNQFASIYTAGTRVSDSTLGGTFDNSALNESQGEAALGKSQQIGGMIFTEAGGNVSINAQNNIERLGVSSSRELPNNWLYRRGNVNSAGQFDVSGFGAAVASTAWWIDFTNFFEGVGALGGGNVSVVAGANVTNVDAVVPTNARASKGTVSNPLASNQTLLELGGGDLTVKAGSNIDAGVYYVERGRGTLTAGGQITTNATRSPSLLSSSTGANAVLDSNSWLPTTLFLGKGGFEVSSRGNVLLGPVANPFLLAPGLGNTFWLKTYFSTYSPDSQVNVTSLGGDITLRESTTLSSAGATPLLRAWMESQQLKVTSSSANSQPWLRLAETSVSPFNTISALMPPTIRASSFTGNISLQGNLTLAPSSVGTIDLLARGTINGLSPTGSSTLSGLGTTTTWSSSTINVSDANPASIPGVYAPLSYQSFVGTSAGTASFTGTNFLKSINSLFSESGGTLGANAVIQTKQALHAPGVLHTGDQTPVRIYAGTGDISGLTLFSPKSAQIFAGRDITDDALYIQNVSTTDGSIVAATRDIIPYNSNSLLRIAGAASGNLIVGSPQAGDIQISGPGSLEVLAGRNLDLGTGTSNSDGTGTGITSIGNARNPYLPFTGADIFAGAGIGANYGLSNSQLDFTSFINQYVKGPNGSAWLAEAMGEGKNSTSFDALTSDQQKRIAMKVFYLALRDAGRAKALGTGSYDTAFAAIATLFPKSGTGEIQTRSRDIRTKSGGDISLFAPSGALTLANSTIGNPLAPPGIITESGGNISIFTNGNVDLGIGRIFTLRGGNEIIWSSTGNIAAGASSKTVQTAPPTRVIIDPQSANVQTDLAGLATGGGIGVLATVTGVAPGNVDLIAPVGVVDAGDAGIRATGNLTIAATAVLNASNITVAGTSTGTPTAISVVAPNVSGISAASNAAGAGTSAAAEAAKQSSQNQTTPPEPLPSIIIVDVLGYGTGDGEQ